MTRLIARAVAPLGTLLLLILSLAVAAPADAEDERSAQTRTLQRSTAASSTAAARRGANYHRPKPGLCYRLSSKQAAQYSVFTRPVSCASPHTTMTAAVVTVPRITKTYPVTALGRCYSAFYRKLGGARDAAMSGYEMFYFGPSRAEQRKGARWLRCDIALRSTSKKLIAMPDPGVLRAGAPWTGRSKGCALGRSQGYGRVSCQGPHAYRASGTVKIRAKKQPSYEAMKALADRACPRITHSNKGAWLAKFPYDEQWRGGLKYVTCLKKTRH